MFWHIPQDTLAEMASSDDESVRQVAEAWAQNMAQYSQKTGASGMPIKNFYIVLRMNKKDFSEKIEFIAEPPMMLPKEECGEFVGIARNKDELDKMVEEKNDDYIHLVFQAKIQGRAAWRDLLMFMGNHNMLQQFN
jgi:hypothetical protein